MEVVFADVRTTKGIIKFDINADNQSEVTLNSQGLKIGNSNATENLSVGGNSIVTGALLVGGNQNPSANLMINRTFGVSPEYVNTNSTIGEKSIVIADSTSGSITLTLLNAVSCGDGRICHIKKSSESNEVTITGGGELDGEVSKVLSSGNRGALKVISSSGNWSILSIYGNSP